MSQESPDFLPHRTIVNQFLHPEFGPVVDFVDDQGIGMEIDEGE